MKKAALKETLTEMALQAYADKESEFPDPESMREAERVVLLKTIDRKWMDHIDDMDQLRQGIGLQAYAQRDPLNEYKMAGYDMSVSYTHLFINITVQCCCADHHAEFAFFLLCLNFPQYRRRTVIFFHDLFFNIICQFDVIPDLQTAPFAFQIFFIFIMCNIRAVSFFRCRCV